MQCPLDKASQLQPKWPRTKTVTSPAFFAPSTSAPSSSAGGVTLKAIMAQLMRVDARLDTLNDELCQVNTRVGRIARWQAVMGGFAVSLSPSPSPQASENESDDGSESDDVDEDDGASSSDDEEMTVSQWLTLCHSWQKGEVVLIW